VIKKCACLCVFAV